MESNGILGFIKTVTKSVFMPSLDKSLQTSDRFLMESVREFKVLGKVSYLKSYKTLKESQKLILKIIKHL